MTASVTGPIQVVPTTPNPQPWEVWWLTRLLPNEDSTINTSKHRYLVFNRAGINVTCFPITSSKFQLHSVEVLPTDFTSYTANPVLAHPSFLWTFVPVSVTVDDFQKRIGVLNNTPATVAPPNQYQQGSSLHLHDKITVSSLEYMAKGLLNLKRLVP